MGRVSCVDAVLQVLRDEPGGLSMAMIANRLPSFARRTIETTVYLMARVGQLYRDDLSGTQVFRPTHGGRSIANSVASSDSIGLNYPPTSYELRLRAEHDQKRRALAHT